MKRPVTWGELFAMLVVWRVLEGVKLAFGLGISMAVAAGMLAVALALLWSGGRESDERRKDAGPTPGMSE